MEWTVIDPDGPLNAGTRWTIQYGTPHTVRVIHGLYLSDTREDDLIIWTIEKHGVPEGRPYSGRRRSFHRWESAKLPVFEVGHVYTQVLSSVSFEDRRTYQVLHVFEDGEKAGQVIALDDLEQIAELIQSERELYRDITGKDGS